MKQKTVYLDPDAYRLRDGVVEGLVYSPAPLPAGVTDSHELTEPEWYEWYAAGYHWSPTRYRMGEEVCLVQPEDVGPNPDQRRPDDWTLRFGPVPGNSDHNITRWHGWRGTTDDTFVTAHGRRRITSIREVRGRVAITVGPDLDPTEA